MKKSEAEQIRELGDRLAAINEKPDTIEDAIKRAMKGLKRIDPEAIFRSRDLQKAIALADAGDISGVANHLISGIDGPERQIQDIFNDIHDDLNAILNPQSPEDADAEYWDDVKMDKFKSDRSGYRPTPRGVGRNV